MIVNRNAASVGGGGGFDIIPAHVHLDDLPQSLARWLQLYVTALLVSRQKQVSSSQSTLGVITLAVYRMAPSTMGDPSGASAE